MIKKLLLPERPRILLLVGTAGFDFQRFDRAFEIAGWEETFGQEMKMIGHDAVGVDRKTPDSGFGAQNFE
jgi:hypothetical protein